MMKETLLFGTGASSTKDYGSLYECCKAAVESGIYSFDTAPSYGTEAVLGKVLCTLMSDREIARSSLFVQTKIDPIQMYTGDLVQHVDKTLNKIGLEYFDALLIHWPIHKYFIRTWHFLESIKKNGVVRRIGFCNMRINHLEELKGIGIVPDILQIERHPLNTFERECQYCKDNGVWLQDYSPLCKMHERLKQSDILKEISQNHNCGTGEVVLRWHMQTGATPIFTSTKPSRIKSYASIANIDLDDNEITRINSLNINYKLYLESLVCPGF